MEKNEKRIVLNKVITLMMETIWAVLISVGILILAGEDLSGVAILLGVGLAANIIMIISEYRTLEIWLDQVVIRETENNSENNSDNK